MRFLYRYQDHDGHLSEGEVAAPSQADAYSLLRKQGIRPMKVWPAPGLANRLAALGKRGWSLIVLGALCLVLGAALSRRGGILPPQNKNQSSAVDLLSPPTFSSPSLPPAPRQQLPPVDVKFKYAADAALAAFARPGDLSCLATTPRASRSARDSRAPVDAGPRPRQTKTQPVLSSTSTLNFNSTTLPAQGTRHPAQGTKHPAQGTKHKAQGTLSPDLSDLPAALATPLAADPADSPDAILLKRIVNGLKNEVSVSLSAGNSPADVYAFLVERQQMEADYRASILRRVEKGTLTRDRANASLRAMGLAMVDETARMATEKKSKFPLDELKE